MMLKPCTLAALLIRLGSTGVELAADPAHPGRLRHRPAALPADLLADLRRHRAGLLGLLAAPYAPADAEAGYVFGERLGVADGLGMPTHTGAPGWALAAGESLEGER